MKSLFWIFSVCLLSVTNMSFAQETNIEVFGTVVEGSQNIPIEFATVMLLDKISKKSIAGSTTDENGFFKLSINQIDFEIEISFIGFETSKIEKVTIEHGKVDLGNIRLMTNTQTLDEVVVRAEKSTTEFQLDKRVFNVGKDISSTGASVLEVLNNVPSVNVNIEGDISLRGNTGVQILINGKPSVLANEQGNALGSITADMIDRIEVITNPSAKYDAEGTSGIINIVIKKEERKGINGSATLNVGAPHNHSFGLSLNRRTEKFNLFSQLGVGFREYPNDRENINRDLTLGTSILSNGTSFKKEIFYNLILGTDYHINDLNVITLSGSYAYEIEDETSTTEFRFMDSDGGIDSRWNRDELTEATNPKFQYELQYKRDFKDSKDHHLLFSAMGNFFGKDQSSDFKSATSQGERFFNDQRIRNDFGQGNYTFKLDYTKPFSEIFTLETGAQFVLNDVNNDYSVLDFVDQEWVEDPSQTNIFNFNQNVLGAYTTAAVEGEKWGLKLGLRLENTDLKTELETTSKVNNRNFTNLFPSAHTSYKISDRFSLQVGYSRRIFRPRMWDLNPFFNIRNNFNVRTGNPDLLPEFSDSYELSSIYILNRSSINFTVYHRYTTDVRERVTTFENNVNTTKPINVGTNAATGIEINGKHSFAKWFSVNGDFNYNTFNRKGNLESVIFDFNADRWSTKLTSKLKLPASIDFEITGQYQSRYETVQSEVSGNLFADLGLRKKIMKGKGVINLSVRDIFASRFRESIIDQPTFYTYNYSRRGRFVTLGFSYGFGKGEAMEFAASRRHH